MAWNDEFLSSLKQNISYYSVWDQPNWQRQDQKAVAGLEKSTAIPLPTDSKNIDTLFSDKSEVLSSTPAESVLLPFINSNHRIYYRWD